jgi:hypothetical protein
LRSFSTLNGANSTITGVNVYITYNRTLVTTPTGPQYVGVLTNSSGVPNNAIVGANLRLISIANETNLQDFINMNGTSQVLPSGVQALGSSVVNNPQEVTANLFNTLGTSWGIPKGANIGMVFVFNTNNHKISLSNSGLPIVADFFSVGLINDGSQNNQRINNGIYRYELEETGDNTGVFTGTNQYVMLNQLNIFAPSTYSALRTIQHDVYVPAIQDMLQSGSCSTGHILRSWTRWCQYTDICTTRYPNSHWCHFI